MILSTQIKRENLPLGMKNIINRFLNLEDDIIQENKLLYKLGKKVLKIKKITKLLHNNKSDISGHEMLLKLYCRKR